MDDTFLCHECGKVFSKLSTLESHVRWKHNDKTTEFICDQCGRVFQKKYNLQKHIEVGVHYVAETVRCAAEDCKFRAQNRKGMCSHYENYHGIYLSETTVYFHNIQQFFDWKTEYENMTRARFVKMSSSRIRKNGIVKCTYLCHRDGNFIPKGKNIRHLKGKGSNKINAHCPAKMEVDISEKLVTCSYVDTHVGHDLDITRLGLTQTEKAEIAQKLTMQVPFEEILHDINSSARSLASSQGLKRLNLLSRKDLWNIVETFKIDPKTVVYSKARAKRKKQLGQFKREAKEHRFFKTLKAGRTSLDESEMVINVVEDNEDIGEDENVIFYPVIVKGENNELYEEYAMVSNDNVDDQNCLIINSQGELESLSGHKVIYTKDGHLQIYESEVENEDENLDVVDDNVLISEAVKIKEEVDLDVCEMEGSDEIVFIDGDTYQIKTQSSECEEAVVENISFDEDTVPVDQEENCDLLVKKEKIGSEIMQVEQTGEESEFVENVEQNGEENEYVESVEQNGEENEYVESVLVEEVPKGESSLDNTEQVLEDNDVVMEYVIISTEGDFNECDVTSIDLDNNKNSTVLTESSVVNRIDGVSGTVSDEKSNESKPQWQEKRRAVLSKLLNVHSLVNNEKQLTVLSKNINSLENVIKSLSKNEELPDGSEGLDS